MKNTDETSFGGAASSVLLDNRVLGLSYIGGGVAWFLHFMVAYLVAEFGCIRGWEAVRFLGITQVAWLVLLATAVMLGAAIGAAVLSYAIGRRRQEAVKPGETGETAAIFTGRAALYTNLVFAFVIAVESIPIFYYLHDC